MRLVIVSHVAHYEWNGALHAHAPYAREIDIWADLFEEVVIAAPLHRSRPEDDATAFTRPNIRVAPQPTGGGETLAAKLVLALKIPSMIYHLAKAMSGADAIHVRCPGNISVVAVVLAPLFSRRLIAKYAGEWRGSGKDELSIIWQRKILRSRWFHGPVTVYNKAPGDPDHIVPFFTSVMSDEQLARGRQVGLRRRFNRPLRVIFVGRLTENKNIHVMLRAVGQLFGEGVRLNVRIVGEGPMRPKLEALATELGIREQVEFTGGVEYEGVLEALETADVLTLVSGIEGWGKALIEGMSYGLVCIGCNRGKVPEILGEGRGFVVEPGSVDELAGVLRKIAARPEDYEPMRRRALEWVSGYSLEGLRDALRAVMIRYWGLPEQTLPRIPRPLALEEIPVETAQMAGRLPRPPSP